MSDKNKEKEKDIEFSSSENKNPYIIPELSNLSNLSNSIEFRENQITSDIDSLQVSLQSNFSSLLNHFKIEELESLSAIFINDELVKSSLMEKISNANNQVVSTLKDIKFFSANFSYLSGFFSHEFSAEDKLKWNQIEEILASIYDSKDGILKQAQDYFLFKVSRKELAKLVSKENISFEEELFLRSILVKGYLVNLRQLILPFYSVDENILIGFKEQRISQLKNQKLDNEDQNADHEITLLRSQISSLQSQRQIIDQKNENLNKKLNSHEITIYNKKFNSGGIALGSVETARYFASFIGHKTNTDTLKTLGNFGLKNTSFFARCVPFVSAAVEAGTQMSNNCVIYNYEKQLKVASIVDNLKSNLIILEQQVTDHYINNILTRLQEKFFEEQKLTFSFVQKAQEEFLAGKKEKLVDQQVSKVRDQYETNILAVQKRISAVYQEKFENQIIIINKQTEEIIAKENYLAEINKKIIILQNDLSSKNQDLILKTAELENLDCRVSMLNEDLAITKRFLENERKSLLTKEKSLKELMSGNLKGSMILQLERANQAREEAEATVNILLSKQNDLEEQIETLSNSSIEKIRETKENRETLEALNEHLNQQLTNLKKEKLQWKEKAMNAENISAQLFKMNINNQQLTSQIELLSKKVSEYKLKIAQNEQVNDLYQELVLTHQETLRNFNFTREKLNARKIVENNQKIILERVQRKLNLSEIENKMLEEQIKQIKIDNFYFGIISKNFFVRISLAIIFIIILIRLIYSIISSIIGNLFKKRKNNDK